VDSHFAIRSFRANLELVAVSRRDETERKDRTMRNTIGRVITIAAAAGTVLTAGAGVAGATGVETTGCERGEFCVWPDEHYGGTILRVALENSNPGECVPLAEGVIGRSFANRSGRPVTVYQGPDCDTEGEFSTYPGGGTFVPEAPFVVRGVQIWER
jgi:peptidase inhibitor family I36